MQIWEIRCHFFFFFFFFFLASKVHYHLVIDTYGTRAWRNVVVPVIGGYGLYCFRVFSVLYGDLSLFPRTRGPLFGGHTDPFFFCRSWPSRKKSTDGITSFLHWARPPGVCNSVSSGEKGGRRLVNSNLPTVFHFLRRHYHSESRRARAWKESCITHPPLPQATNDQSLLACAQFVQKFSDSTARPATWQSDLYGVSLPGVVT